MMLIYIGVIISLRFVYGLYIAYTLFSFIVLLERKQNSNLVVNGPDIFKLMENIQKQAEAMEMRTDPAEADASAIYSIVKKDVQTENQPTKSIIFNSCLLYTSPSPRDATLSRMPSSA
eukprot:TRINITY_DN2250_c0_g1_i2.p3 TRINITY_DN2250_c0_g1~~TRINITY_DN2250_c0_g1_i2.p3  ORF type:complete len:118 (+),score=29.20 TRINITY_DN2250_c0_g1_i2:281-634(+)